MTEYEFLKQQVEEIRARQKAEQEAPLRAEIATLLAEVEGWRQAASYISDLFDPVKGLSVSPEILRAVAQGAKHANTTLRSEVEKLRGIRPEWPPEPPNGSGLPRYGLRWNGPSTPVATPMEDGYWTPWHLAEAGAASLTKSVMRERESVEILSRHLHAAEAERDDLLGALRGMLRRHSDPPPGLSITCACEACLRARAAIAKVSSKGDDK